MFLKKALIILILLIMVNSSVYATVSEIDIFPEDEIVSLISTNTRSIQFDITIDSNETFHISSGKSAGIYFDVNYINNPPTYATAILSKTATTASVDASGVPTIPVNSEDIVTISADGISNSLSVDSVAPVNKHSPLADIFSIAATRNYLNFYAEKITINYTNSDLNDANLGIDKHIIYVVPVESINNYATAYTKKYVIANTSSSLDINSLLNTTQHPKITDGNYYIVIDANDLAGNSIASADVIATKKNVYFDNTAPLKQLIKVGGLAIADMDITNSTLSYLKEKTYSLFASLTETSGINSGYLRIRMPNAWDHIAMVEDYVSGYTISEAQLITALEGYPPETADVYIVNLNATDNVGNSYNYDFNILVDLNTPPKPTINTLTIEDIDKNVTISWASGGADTGGSGFKEYKVYKGSGSFSTITNQELVCTTTSTSCKDSDDKSNDDDIYYGVVAVDNAGNVSDANSVSIWTGPATCKVTINDNSEYTNTAVVDLEIDNLSSDVNAMSFSCNNSTYSTAIAADDTNTFNITAGNGCSTTNEEKTVYVKVISKDYPTRFTICSDKIFFDNTAPTDPTNLKATPQSDGSVKLTWSASTEANDPDTVKYRVYYSTSSNLTNTSDYKEATTNTYTFSSNQDINLYFKVSALDLRNNESALSASVLANVKKIGPRFSITLDPSNDVNGKIYVSSGTKTIDFVSDETLTGSPQVSIKKANTSTYENITSTYDGNTKTGTASYNFATVGTNIIKINGTNTKNEQAGSELEVIMDNVVPDFNFNYELIDPITYKIWVYNLPTDVFKVEYLVDTNVVYFKQQVTDYNFNSYDMRTTPDGNHTMYIKVYDNALNEKIKSFTYIIDLVDEDKVICDQLRDEIDISFKALEEDFDLFKAVGIIDEQLEVTINTKKSIILEKRAEGNAKYSDENYLYAKTDYQFAKNEIQAIYDLLPKIEIIKTTSTNIIYDANIVISLEEITDANTVSKTKALYDQNIVSATRNLEVLKIGNQNFFSVTLTINNNGSTAKELTIVETIPKSFANNVSKLIFNKEVEILVKDPVIKYTLTIPSKSSEEIIYRSLTPVTSVDATTKYNLITEAFMTKLPLIMDGNVTTDKLSIIKPINMNIIIYFFSVVILLVIAVLIISAINNYKNKKLEEFKPDAKKMMNDYFVSGDTEKNQGTSQKPIETETTSQEVKNPEDKKKKEADKFNEDYQYILSAIKKR